MTFFIMGLGLIGASYADKLTEKGYTVYGYDEHVPTLKTAKSAGIIDHKSQLSDIEKADCVIIALYPDATVQFIKNHLDHFKPTQTLTDVCGVKTPLLTQIHAVLPKHLTYTSHHPMAGKETRGIEARDKTLFNNANFLIIKSSRSHDHDITRLKTLANALSFGRISILSDLEHDHLVTYTSQLTHVLATCLIHSAPNVNATLATGDSFKDLTRIAKINASLWTELFLTNTTLLLTTIKTFKKELNIIETHLENQDENALIDYLNAAKKRRVFYD